MNKGCGVWMATLLMTAGLGGGAVGESRTVAYDVWFKDAVAATQTVSIARADGSTTVTASFAAQLHVFVAQHPYSEDLAAPFRDDGTVERFQAVRIDGPQRTEVTGELQDDERLRVIRTDAQGVATSFIARADYDFHSLILYGRAPADFLPARGPARVLQIAEGFVQPMVIQTISESETTTERQHVSSTHLIWTSDTSTSHSWHPDRFGDVPRRYVRQTPNGEFTFQLPR